MRWEEKPKETCHDILEDLGHSTQGSLVHYMEVERDNIASFI